MLLSVLLRFRRKTIFLESLCKNSYNKRAIATCLQQQSSITRRVNREKLFSQYFYADKRVTDKRSLSKKPRAFDKFFNYFLRTLIRILRVVEPAATVNCEFIQTFQPIVKNQCRAQPRQRNRLTYLDCALCDCDHV